MIRKKAARMRCGQGSPAAELAGWQRLDRRIDRVLLVVLLLLALLACLLFLAGWREERRGIVDADPRDFDSLLARNADTVAWLQLEDTLIDHPVVQGKDNFEYLDKDFDGGFYAGGTLFLDAGNAGDFSDLYSIIHGHHMAGRAMFSSLENFLDPDFARLHRQGRLLTPTWDYRLELLGAGIYDAYDSRVYAPGDRLPADRMAEAADGPARTGGAGECGGAARSGDAARTGGVRKVLALSTCSGEMNDDRIVVFWSMTDRRKHEKAKN